uniref:Uncharacterized protein n=1 Tax=Rhizophora mucronata TaxID=61149 RepID=A0A2P2NNP0_RHIMU
MLAYSFMIILSFKSWISLPYEHNSYGWYICQHKSIYYNYF